MEPRTSAVDIKQLPTAINEFRLISAFLSSNNADIKYITENTTWWQACVFNKEVLDAFLIWLSRSYYEGLFAMRDWALNVLRLLAKYKLAELERIGAKRNEDSECIEANRKNPWSLWRSKGGTEIGQILLLYCNAAQLAGVRIDQCAVQYLNISSPELYECVMATDFGCNAKLPHTASMPKSNHYMHQRHILDFNYHKRNYAPFYLYLCACQKALKNQQTSCVDMTDNCNILWYIFGTFVCMKTRMMAFSLLTEATPRRVRCRVPGRQFYEWTQPLEKLLSATKINKVHTLGRTSKFRMEPCYDIAWVTGKNNLNLSAIVSELVMTLAPLRLPPYITALILWFVVPPWIAKIVNWNSEIKLAPFAIKLAQACNDIYSKRELEVDSKSPKI